MSARDLPPAFDSHVEDYDEQLMRGLRASGESKEFFARGRVEHLRRWWLRSGRPEPERVLDYGCGVGDVAPVLAEAFPRARVLGLDPSARCVERALSRHAAPRVAFAVLEGFRAPGEPADLIHLNGVVHHVPPADRSRLFEALRDALAADGVVALFENNPWNPGTRWVMSRIPFDRDAVRLSAPESRCHLRAAGLLPLQTRFLFWFPRPLRALRGLEPWLAAVPFGAQYGVYAARPPARRASPSSRVLSASSGSMPGPKATM